MLPRKNNSDCITRLECTTVSSEIKRDLSAIKTALIGPDMQGGLVKKISDLDAKVVDLALTANHVASENREEQANVREREKTASDNWSREKVALIGAIGAIIGLIVGHLLDIIAI